MMLYDEVALWTEVERILEEDPERQFTPGQQCYHNLVHCANPAYFLTHDTTLALEEFMTMKRFNIPPARDIDSANYNRIVIYSAIDEEYNAAIKLESNG